MDYHKDYTEYYKKDFQEKLNLINDLVSQLQLKHFKFETIRNKINNQFSQFYHSSKKQISNLKLEPILYSFYENTELYIEEHALEASINYDVYKQFIDLNTAQIHYKEFLKLMSNYWVCEYLKFKIYDETWFNSNSIKGKLKKLKKDPLVDLKDFYLAKRASPMNLMKQNQTKPDSLEDIEWKNRIKSFTFNEKTLILSIYFDTCTKIKRPEFIKIIMITGGLYDLNVLEGDYNKEPIYTQILNGVNSIYSNKQEFLEVLIQKIRPFKLKVISGHLVTQLTRTTN